MRASKTVHTECGANTRGCARSVNVVVVFNKFDYKSSAVAEIGDRLATIDMGRRGGGCCAPLRGGEMGPHLTQRRLAEAYLHTKWHRDPSSGSANMDINGKLGAVPLLWGERWGELGRHLTQCNAMSPGPRPASIPSGILMHPAVWSQ